MDDVHKQEEDSFFRNSLSPSSEGDRSKVRRTCDGITEIWASTGDKVAHSVGQTSLSEDLEDGPVGENGCVGRLPYGYLNDE